MLGMHFQRAYQGEIRYLNINTTFNSSILLNYRQTECAFWTQYLPTVVGVLVPTYPPTTEYWWEPKEPLQIAFWSMSVACFFLIVLVVICCIMWRNAKRWVDSNLSTLGATINPVLLADNRIASMMRMSSFMAMAWSRSRSNAAWTTRTW